MDQCTAKMMIAVVVTQFGGPEVLQVKDVPVPQLQAGEVLVKVLAAGVNPVETYKRAGNYAKLPTLPFTPGGEGAGIVESVADDVDTSWIGKRVFIKGTRTGTYAQYTATSVSHLHVLPEHVLFEQGAAVPTAYKTAYRALFTKGHARPNQYVLVHGASGGVGLAAVQLARTRGMKVIGTASTKEGQDLVKAQGAEFVISHREEGYMAKIKAHTGGKGVDVIIEMLANVNLGSDLEILAHGGTVCIVGNRGEVTINPRQLMLKESSVVGVLGGTKEEIAEGFAAIEAGLASKALSPVVGQRYPIKRAADAQIEVIEHKAGTSGKIVILPWE